MSQSEHSPLDNYEVTADGRVFSVGLNWRGYGRREMRQHVNNRGGYPYVRLVVGGKRMLWTVHRLVALAHLPPWPSEKHQVRHLNGDPSDNRAVNLAWGTTHDNAADRERHGRTSRGPAHSAAIRKGLIHAAA